MNQFSAASTMSTYNTVIRCNGNRSKGWGAPGGPMQGPKRFKIIKNDKNLAIVSSFIASILVECWIFCKETVNWWDGTSLKQNDLCRGPSRGLTLLKIARKKNLGNFVIFWLLMNSFFRFYPLACWNLLTQRWSNEYSVQIHWTILWLENRSECWGPYSKWPKITK